MYRNLLVPLDGSAFAEHALPLALSIAKRAGSGITIVHAHHPLAALYVDSPVLIDSSLESDLMKHKREYLDRVASHLATVSQLRVKPLFMVGEIVETIGRVAASTEVDLVVMTTHARGPLGRFWLGSVADALLRHLSVPILLVRAQEGPADYNKDVTFRHILIPLDGSALAEQILDPSVQFGKLMDTDLTLVRVLSPAMLSGFGLQGGQIGLQARSIVDRALAIQKELRKSASDYLEKMAQKLRAESLRIKTIVAEDQQPGVAILREAAANAADLIALETHGRRGLARMMLGSVADKVVRGASVPVLLQRPVYG
jgi:nucleotide-binding universal stress UspA family protein